MWVIVAFIDDTLAAVPISWLINSNGQKRCFWPLQDERKKRAKNEIPPSFGKDDWELHDCAILLNGAIYDDFEDALAIEMGCLDIDDVNTNELPKLSWNEEENEIERIITENTETANLDETSVIGNFSFSDFQDLLNRPHLCSTVNEFENVIGKGDEIPTSENYASDNITEKNVQPTIHIQSDTEMLDTILKNQEEKKKILVKLMNRMYSLESAVGYNSS